MNFGELKAKIALWLDRTDLTAVIPDFVQLAEARIARDLRMPGQITVATVTVLAGQSSAAMPADFAEAVSISNTVGATFVSPAKLAELAGTGAAWDEFTIQSGNLTLAAPAPSDASFTVTYYAKFPALVGDSDTNEILTNHPGLYLYCSLAEAAVFLSDDARAPLWEAKYRKETEDIRSANWSNYSLAEQYARSVA